MFEIKRDLSNQEDFERILFVLKARLNDKGHSFTSVLHVEMSRTGSRLVATDNKRMHLAEIATKIKSGDYKPVVTRDTVSFGEPVTGIDFPNWKHVIPDKTRKRGTIDLANTGIGKVRPLAEKMSKAFCAFMKRTGETVNIRYLEDLPKTEWTIFCQSEKQKAILLKQKDTEREVLAVLIPLDRAA
jgi:hypothetical protein